MSLRVCLYLGFVALVSCGYLFFSISYFAEGQMPQLPVLPKREVLWPAWTPPHHIVKLRPPQPKPSTVPRARPSRQPVQQPAQQLAQPSEHPIKEEVWPIVVSTSSLIKGNARATRHLGCTTLSTMFSLEVPRVHIIRTDTDPSRARIRDTLRFLIASNYTDDQLVMYVDNFDVMFLRKPFKGEIRQKYMELANGDLNAVIISTECTCYPFPADNKLCAVFAKDFPAPFNYLNSEQYMGPVGAVKRLLQAVDDSYSLPRDRDLKGGDQEVMMQFCFGDQEIKPVERKVKCVLDNKGEIFRSAFEFTEGCPGFNENRITLTSNTVEPCRFDKTQMCPTDPTTKGQPLTMHYNGNVDQNIDKYLEHILPFTKNLFGTGDEYDDTFRDKCQQTRTLERVEDSNDDYIEDEDDNVGDDDNNDDDDDDDAYNERGQPVARYHDEIQYSCTSFESECGHFLDDENIWGFVEGK
eukprot:c4645_g1_i1.p1 GENE.c4645_g1_i1~~c4645_g1_i1.p1  ORF type:complete len:475 (-),score=62.03 c4645_g1_i1:163-1563(-)